MKILPDELPPTDTPALPEHAEFDESPTLPSAIINFNGKNMFVNLTNGKSLVGHLECSKGYFRCGREESWFAYEQIASFREV